EAVALLEPRGEDPVDQARPLDLLERRRVVEDAVVVLVALAEERLSRRQGPQRADRGRLVAAPATLLELLDRLRGLQEEPFELRELLGGALEVAPAVLHHEGVERRMRRRLLLCEWGRRSEGRRAGEAAGLRRGVGGDVAG